MPHFYGAARSRRPAKNIPIGPNKHLIGGAYGVSNRLCGALVYPGYASAARQQGRALVIKSAKSFEPKNF